MDKQKIDVDALLAALHHYGDRLSLRDSVFIHRASHGYQMAISLHDVCNQSAILILDNMYMLLKYKRLIAELKRRGAEGLYEDLMNEPFDKALEIPK